MATVRLDAIDLAYVDQETPYTHYTVDNNAWYTIAGFRPSLQQKCFLMKFEPIPSALRHYQLVGAQIMACLSAQGTELYDATILYGIMGTFDGSTATWASVSDNIPETGFESIGIETVRKQDAPADYETPPSVSAFWQNRNAAKALLESGCAFAYNPANLEHFILFRPTLIADGLFYVTITYDETQKQTSQVTYKNGPNSGYSNPRNATTFSWALSPSDSSIICADDSFTQTSATFYWKTSTDSTYTAINISGDTQAVTIPANTFQVNATIQWYVSATDDESTTTQTSVYSFSTAAGAVTATCVAPVQSVEDGSGPIDFRWTITSADGQPASRVRGIWRKYSDPDEEQYYNVLFDVNDPLTSFTAQGNTFPAGEILWGVRVWNIDGTEGTRDYKTFICVAAPNPVEGLNATEVPFSTISWQSEEQQAYQVIVDGVVVKKAFGPDVYSYSLEEPLGDGNHTISVIVQGVYGFWSQPSEITITIQNEPDADITLTGQFEIDALLSWGTTRPVFVYRDEKKIAKTNMGTFADRVVLGSHEYFVLEPLGDGNYNKSNILTGEITVECGYIGALSGGQWVKLEYSKLNPLQTYTKNRTIVAKHFSGSKYPVVEESNFFDFVGNFNVMFDNEQDAAAFTALLGEMVVIKNRANIVVVGMLSQYDERVEDFYYDFDFIVQQSEWEDYVDETND